MADLADLLEKTSRTFALSIPRLPEPVRQEVTVAYLLFRIADTFEDGTRWPAERRVEGLLRFGELLAAVPPDPAAAAAAAGAWAADPPDAGHAGYLELLAETPFVLESFWQLSAAAQAAIRHHLGRTVEGMARYVRAGGPAGGPRLDDLAELRDYCYVVAGIVGEMLTDLYLASRRELAPVAAALRSRAGSFGEGLQLVNILKDAATDADEGRRYLPPGVDRAEVFALARRDLDRAAEYTLVLQQAGAPAGMVAFNAGPLALARASLERIEQAGAGAKLTREEVFTLLDGMEGRLASGEPVV